MRQSIMRAMERFSGTEQLLTDAQELETPQHPIALRDDQITEQETKLLFTCDRLYDIFKRNYRVKAADGQADGQTLFSVNHKSWSSTVRREVSDSSGLPLLDIRHSYTSRSKGLYCSLPGDSRGPSARFGKRVLEMGHLGWYASDVYDVRFESGMPAGATGEAPEPSNVVLEVRGQRGSPRVLTNVFCDGKQIATFRRLRVTERQAREWREVGEYEVLEATVVPNVDLTVVSIPRLAEIGV